MHAFEGQCFRVLHRVVYRSWCVNSHEPIHGNLELEAVIAAKDFQICTGESSLRGVTTTDTSKWGTRRKLQEAKLSQVQVQHS